MEERLLEILREAPDRAFDLPELMERAHLHPRKEKEVKKLLKGLVRDGTLEREPGRRYRVSRAGRTLEGRVVIDRRGFPGFVPDTEPSTARKRTEHRTVAIPFLEEGPDPSLPRSSSRWARFRKQPSTNEEPITEVTAQEVTGPTPKTTMLTPDALVHDDRVRVELVSRGRRPKTYAKLLELVERPEKRQVGMFREIAGACVVDLDEAPNPTAGQSRRIREVLIPPDATGGATDGELVEVTFEQTDPSGRGSPIGKVIEVLGRPGERDSELRKLMIEHNLDLPFPDEVLQQTEQYGHEPTPSDYEARKDVRHLPLMTIDGETAKDFDDAVCAVREGDRYRIYVAIADVSYYVRAGTPLDQEAYRRGTSTYLTDRAIPMLPEKLSNGLCSLNPNVDRLCMLAELIVSANGRVTDARFSQAVMRSKARLTYTQVAQALEGEPDPATKEVLPTLLLLSSVASKLLERRLRRGSLDLDLPEPVVEFDASGDPTTAVRRPRNSAHRLIEDLMIATNEAVARFFLEKELDTLFRVHSPPDPDKMQSFARLCLELGIEAHVSERPSPAEVSHLLVKLSEHNKGSALNALLLRTLSAARYHAENDGHFGLASEAYLHFTSPIRRYPDLVVHRLLRRTISREGPMYSHAHLQKMGDDCSAAERRAMAAERASMELDRALIASKRMGTQLSGTISGIQTFGLFVATLDPFLEGMIPVQTLPDDFYEADEHQSTLIGTRHGHRFSLGDPIEVEIYAVNLGRRHIEFRYIPQMGSITPQTPPVSSRLDPRRLARKLGMVRKARGAGGARGRASNRPRGRNRGPKRR